MDKTYKLKVAGLTRDLKMFKVNDNLTIAAFILFGDVELTVGCAQALLEKLPEHDIMVTAEAKSIGLIHELARQSGVNSYVIFRKAPKVYMKNIVSVSVNSITTQREQTLCIGEDEANLIKGKRVLIVDDVISTGESLKAIEELVLKAGGIIAGKAAVLAEGDAAKRDDIVYLAPLPLFDGNGEPIK